ncbi:hypothetical protein [Roseburia intestinalis]
MNKNLQNGELKERADEENSGRKTHNIWVIGTDMKSITENVVAQAVGTAPSIGGSCNVKA